MGAYELLIDRRTWSAKKYSLSPLKGKKGGKLFFPPFSMLLITLVLSKLILVGHRVQLGLRDRTHHVMGLDISRSVRVPCLHPFQQFPGALQIEPPKLL